LGFYISIFLFFYFKLEKQKKIITQGDIPNLNYLGRSQKEKKE
jgi:hypothetical protein